MLNRFIKGSILLAMLSATHPVGAVNDAQGIAPAAAIVERHSIHFDEPPKCIPSRFSVDAPLMGNGYTAVSLSGTPDKQTFHLARNDFWRLRSALDESFPAVIGRIQLTVPVLADATYSIDQNMYDGETRGCFRTDSVALEYQTYVAASCEDVLVIKLKSTGRRGISGTLQLKLPMAEDSFVQLPYERNFADRRDSGSVGDNLQFIVREFVDSVDIPTMAAAALAAPLGPGGSFTLAPGEEMTAVCAFSSNFKADDPKATAISVAKNSSGKLEEIDSAHRSWWHDYWDRSYVSLPDSVIENQYYKSLYGMGSCSRDKDFPPSIFGSWITKERPFWNGDYHLNYNHMAPYYGLYSSNRIEQADPYYAPLLDFMDRGEYYSSTVTGIDGGILLPVGIGPKGIETTRRSPFMDKYYHDWIDNGNIEDEGMFWGQRSNAAYAVVPISIQYYLTLDTAFATKVYPFVKMTARFWEKYLSWDGNRYVIYNDAVHEGTIGDFNPILSLGLVRTAMQTACDMSAALNLDADLRLNWKKIINTLADYPTQIHNGRKVFRYSEKGTEWWGDNTLGIQHIYPAGRIGHASDPDLLTVARNTIELMNRWQDANGTNSFFPAAVRVGISPDTILTHLHDYCLHTYPNGFQRGNPHGIENLSTVPNTINEMLCSGHQSVVRLFPCWPKHLDASFSNIRVEGAFLVSATMSDGAVGQLEIRSERGSLLRLRNPWAGRHVLATSESGESLELKGDIMEMPTSASTSYSFVPF